MKFSLLIQGPIISIGKTNSNLKQNETNNKVIVFNAVEYIYENIKQYNDLFEKIIISTWSKENIQDLQIKLQNFNKVKIIQLEDSYNAIYQKKFKNDIASNVNNKLKMFNGINKSLHHFDTDEMIVRIRTDQKVNLKLIIDELKKNNKISKFYVPYLTGNGYFQDFYFAANKKVMSKYLNFYCEDYKEIVLSPHYEFFQKIFTGMNFKNKYLLATSSITQKQLGKIIEKRYFRPLPGKVYKNIFWRGNEILNNPRRDIFFTTDQETYKKILNSYKKYSKRLLLLAVISPTRQTLNFKNNIKLVYFIIEKILISTGISKISRVILSRLI